jgi:hypothetical protein
MKLTQIWPSVDIGYTQSNCADPAASEIVEIQRMVAASGVYGNLG